MTAPYFRVRPHSRRCQESLCLDDYEAAWLKHQQIQFRRAGEGSFEKFRTRVWGNSSYADGMWIRIRGRQEQRLAWSDVASGGRIEFSDVQSLMGLGLVEFLVPTHRCISSRVPPQLYSFPVRNLREFQSMVKGMQELSPLHGEGAGNIFWPVCLPDETLQGLTSAPPPALPFVPGTEEEEEEYCDGGEVDFFDEDLGEAICEGDDSPALRVAMQIGIGTFLSSSVGYGAGFALAAAAAAAAPEIARIVEE